MMLCAKSAKECFINEKQELSSNVYSKKLSIIIRFDAIDKLFF